MVESDAKFYFKFSLILAAAFFIWFFSTPGSNVISRTGEPETNPVPTSALNGFTPPALVVFNGAEGGAPARNWVAPFLELQAEAALAVSGGTERVYYNKNIEVRRPMASLTKLMTAIVVLENYNLDDKISVSQKAVARDGDRGNLRVGETLTVRSLLTIMLMDSSNDAAGALAEQRPDFIDLMNKKSKELGLKNTHFMNPDGIDEDGHYSTALDVAEIFGYLINNYPQAFEIMKTKELVLYSSDGKFLHRLANSNELLGRVGEVKAGKTGYTDKAGGSLALLISGLDINNKNRIITVVLGSSDRFGESEKLIQWLKAAYVWN